MPLYILNVNSASIKRFENGAAAVIDVGKSKGYAADIEFSASICNQGSALTTKLAKRSNKTRQCAI